MHRSKAATSWHHWLYWAAEHDGELVFGPKTLSKSFEKANARRRSISSSGIGSGSGSPAAEGTVVSSSGISTQRRTASKCRDQLGIAVQQDIHADLGVEDLGGELEPSGQVRGHGFERRAGLALTGGRAQQPPVDQLTLIRDDGIGVAHHRTSRLSEQPAGPLLEDFERVVFLLPPRLGTFLAALEKTQDRVPDAERLQSPATPVETQQAQDLRRRGDRFWSQDASLRDSFVGDRQAVAALQMDDLGDMDRVPRERWSDRAARSAGPRRRRDRQPLRPSAATSR